MDDEERLVDAFRGGDPGAWTDLPRQLSEATLRAALERMERDPSFDTRLARAAFMSLPPGSASLLAEVFDRDHSGADFVALALAASRERDAVPILADLLGDTDLGTIAVAGLSRQPESAFDTVRARLTGGRKSTRIAALEVFRSWRTTDAWREAILHAWDAERTAAVRCALEPLVADARGEVSSRTIEAIERDLTAQDSESLAAQLEQILHVGLDLHHAALDDPERSAVAAHQHLEILTEGRDAVEAWWTIVDTIGVTAVSSWLSVDLLMSDRLECTTVQRMRYLQKLLDAGDDTVQMAIRQLDRVPQRPDVREMTGGWIARNATDDDLDQVAHKLRDPDSDCRRWARDILKMAGPPGAMAALTQLDAPRAVVRADAARVVIAAPARPVREEVERALLEERASEPEELLVEAWFRTQELAMGDLASLNRDELRDHADEWAALCEEHGSPLALPALHWSDGAPVEPSVVRWLLDRIESSRERGSDPVVRMLAERLATRSLDVLRGRLFGEAPLGIEPWVAHAWCELADSRRLLECRAWRDDETRASATLTSRARALADAGALGRLLLWEWSVDGRYSLSRLAARSELCGALDAESPLAALLRDLPAAGFRSDRTRPWRLGSRSGLSIRWTGSTVEVLNEEGDALKSIPSPRASDPETDVEADLDDLRGARQVASFVHRSLVTLLEHAMLDSETIDIATLKTLTGHPIAHDVLARVLWGLERAKQPPLPLRFDEEGGFADGDDLPFATSPAAAVRPIHPADMTADARARWAAIFADYEIVQPFEQLDRRIFVPLESELSASRFRRFSSEGLEARRLYWTVMGSYGWHLGPHDGWKRWAACAFPRWDLTAVVEWSPGFLPQGWDTIEEQWVHGGSIVRGTDAINPTDGDRIALIDAPPAVFSEIVHLLWRASGAASQSL